MKKIIYIVLTVVFSFSKADETLHTSVYLLKSRTGFKVRVTFENISHKALHIYFIDNPVFNTFQSYFYVVDRKGKKCFLSDDPSPHGLHVGRSDFHMIGAGAKKSFIQKIDNIDCNIKKRAAKMVWVYKNRIDK